MRRPAIWLIILVLSVATSCNPDEVIGPPAERSPLSGPIFAIQDGATGGNSHFFFLPPLVRPPRYTGTSDGTLQPVVTVCALTTSSSCGSTIARFTTAPTPRTFEQIRYERFTSSYYLIWDTRHCLAGPCALNPAVRYRLAVSVSGAELGWVDLDVVAKLRELIGVNWGTDVGLVRDLPLPIRFRIEQGSVAVLSIREVITVEDAPPVLKVEDVPPVTEPLEIAINEKIQVSDGVGVLPPVTITVHETVRVVDQEIVLPPLSISVQETVGVTDAANVTFE